MFLFSYPPFIRTLYVNKYFSQLVNAFATLTAGPVSADGWDVAAAPVLPPGVDVTAVAPTGWD